jgi:ApaG protein
MYHSVTRHISVTAKPSFMPEQSDPDQKQYFWAYTITIANEGKETVQLLSRHWIITDGDGKTQEVRGEGVVGEQPTLAPGMSFTYTSGCPLATPQGIMRGTYLFQTDRGELFAVLIPAFSLDLPEAKRVLH